MKTLKARPATIEGQYVLILTYRNRELHVATPSAEAVARTYAQRNGFTHIQWPDRREKVASGVYALSVKTEAGTTVMTFTREADAHTALTVALAAAGRNVLVPVPRVTPAAPCTVIRAPHGAEIRLRWVW